MLIYLHNLSSHFLIYFLHSFSPFLNFKAHFGLIRNGNEIKRSERVNAIPYLKGCMRSSIGRSLAVAKFCMGKLGVLIS